MSDQRIVVAKWREDGPDHIVPHRAGDAAETMIVHRDGRVACEGIDPWCSYDIGLFEAAAEWWLHFIGEMEDEYDDAPFDPSDLVFCPPSFVPESTLAAEKARGDGLEVERDRLRQREEHFSRALHVADGGQYRNDWDGAIDRVVKKRDEAIRLLGICLAEMAQTAISEHRMRFGGGPDPVGPAVAFLDAHAEHP